MAFGQFKKGVVSKVSSVISAPTRAYYGAKSKISNMRADSRIAARNFNNRQDDSNKYRSTSYWKKNKN